MNIRNLYTKDQILEQFSNLQERYVDLGEEMSDLSTYLEENIDKEKTQQEIYREKDGIYRGNNKFMDMFLRMADKMRDLEFKCDSIIRIMKVKRAKQEKRKKEFKE